MQAKEPEKRELPNRAERGGAQKTTAKKNEQEATCKIQWLQT